MSAVTTHLFQVEGNSEALHRVLLMYVVEVEVSKSI